MFTDCFRMFIFVVGLLPTQLFCQLRMFILVVGVSTTKIGNDILIKPLTAISVECVGSGDSTVLATVASSAKGAALAGTLVSVYALYSNASIIQSRIKRFVNSIATNDVVNAGGKDAAAQNELLEQLLESKETHEGALQAAHAIVHNHHTRLLAADANNVLLVEKVTGLTRGVELLSSDVKSLKQATVFQGKALAGHDVQIGELGGAVSRP
jgi:hypothetical protein